MKFIIIGLIVVMTLFELFVGLLNDKQKDKPLPDNVKDVYNSDKYDQWLRYSMAHQKLSVYQTLITSLLMIIFLLFGVFQWFESLSVSITDNERMQTLLFLFFFLMTSTLIGLPFKVVRVFKIEAAFGFNKMTKKLFIKDQIKALMLTIILGGMIALLVHSTYRETSNPIVFSFIVWASISLIMILVSYLNTKVFIKLFNKLTPLEAGELKDKIDVLVKKANFKINHCYIMDASKRSTKLNAFFSGFGRTKTVVLFDTLVEKMTHEEILAVLAHELGHATYKDTITLMIEQVLSIGLYIWIFGYIMAYQAFFEAFNISADHIGFGLVLWTILLNPISTLLGLVTNHIARRFEYRADRYAAMMTTPKDMKSALITLYQQNLSNLNPHPLYVKLHYNHPTLSNRMTSIEKGASHAI